MNAMRLIPKKGSIEEKRSKKEKERFFFPFLLRFSSIELLA